MADDGGEEGRKKLKQEKKKKKKKKRERNRTSRNPGRRQASRGIITLCFPLCFCWPQPQPPFSRHPNQLVMIIN
ncbi:hypothetical protein TRV_04520 [Trichophyton verrucosum HKI 0517]|uniref:Uncharacterized protein n=1 Tax=Trichophyton verrucosum (strain HKI 0517) TaxID=663202 RepID=D4DBM0_TRIVH|nr:uncharacterized protein TRV_04520 [Trichophyton verrucosum HKI 0517]EFE40747.1 hypothetical protein TRV_04520 [Trichophyton verrucosum HKI 0517]